MPKKDLKHLKTLKAEFHYTNFPETKIDDLFLSCLWEVYDKSVWWNVLRTRRTCFGEVSRNRRTRRVCRRVSEKSTTSLQVRVVEFATDTTDTTNRLFTARCERQLRVQV